MLTHPIILSIVCEGAALLHLPLSQQAQHMLQQCRQAIALPAGLDASLQAPVGVPALQAWQAWLVAHLDQAAQHCRCGLPADRLGAMCTRRRVLPRR